MKKKSRLTFVLYRDNQRTLLLNTSCVWERERERVRSSRAMVVVVVWKSIAFKMQESAKVSVKKVSLSSSSSSWSWWSSWGGESLSLVWWIKTTQIKLMRGIHLKNSLRLFFDRFLFEGRRVVSSEERKKTRRNGESVYECMCMLQVVCYSCRKWSTRREMEEGSCYYLDISNTFHPFNQSIVFIWERIFMWGQWREQLSREYLVGFLTLFTLTYSTELVVVRFILHIYTYIRILLLSMLLTLLSGFFRQCTHIRNLLFLLVKLDCTTSIYSIDTRESIWIKCNSLSLVFSFRLISSAFRMWSFRHITRTRFKISCELSVCFSSSRDRDGCVCASFFL